MTPPTQYLRPNFLLEITDDKLIDSILSDIEDYGVVLREHSIADLRRKVRSRFRRYDFAMLASGKPPSGNVIDAVIRERLAK